MALRGESGPNTCLLAGKAVPRQKLGTHGTFVGVNPKGNDLPPKKLKWVKWGEHMYFRGEGWVVSSKFNIIDAVKDSPPI